VDALAFDWPQYVTQVHLPGLERFAVRERNEVGAAPEVEANSAMLDAPITAHRS
jgi:alcohol-forming fatty acyl-CoA reductase